MKILVLLGFCLILGGKAEEGTGIIQAIETALGMGNKEVTTESPAGIIEKVTNMTQSFLNSLPADSSDSIIGSIDESKNEKSEEPGFLSSIFGGSSTETAKTEQKAIDPFTSEICQQCKCIDTQPFYIDCARKDLQELYLPASWPQNTSLTQMDATFQDNQLTVITQFTALPLISLSFRKNLLKTIQNAAFKNLQQLEYLDLSDNSLSHESLTRDVFQGQYSETDYEPLNLKTLKLEKNNIHSLDHDTFDHLANLETLELNDNPLEVIDHQTAIALTSLRKLKKLNLAQTGLRDLPEGVLHAIKGISVLFLNGNKFERVPSELQRASNLKYLNFNNNPVEVLDTTSFQGLGKLRQLNISSMDKLHYIGPNTFTPLQSLKEMWCSFNPLLKKIHSKAFEDVAIDPTNFQFREFHFRGNGISVLPQNLLPWDSLDVIDIEENLYTCSGKPNEWIKTKLIPIIEDKTPDMTLNILCNSPSDLKGTPLNRVEFNDAIDNYSDNDLDSTGDYPMPRPSTFTSAVMVISIIAAIAIIAGIVAMGFFAIRRRGVQQIYQSPGQFVRYVRAQTDEFGEKKYQDDERAILPQDQMYRDEP